jgi:serine phosphatase RsbU (regulator of sigma subunit)
MLELPPAESLQQLDELMQNIGEREPHFATCAYAVYDGVTGEIELAVAGHLPPLLVHPDGRNEYLEVTPSPPLGIGNGVVETQVIGVADGSLFVLYTDGLVESPSCGASPRTTGSASSSRRSFPPSGKRGRRSATRSSAGAWRT